MNCIFLIAHLIIYIHSFNISTFKINFFKEDSKLYYVNAMNNNNGDLYFEFWGENNAKRYFIGKSYLTEEQIKFNNNKEIYSIEANSITNYHESVIVNNDDNINIFSMGIDNFDFINLQNGIFSSEPTSKYIFQNKGEAAFRNCLLRLKDNTYFSSIILYKKYCYLFIHCHRINFEIFNFTSESVNNYNRLTSIQKTIDQLNSTSCFQTESGYIQCAYSVLKSEEIKTLSIGIYDLSMNEIACDIYLGRQEINSFSKIFHIKDEIGAYFFFDAENNNVPKIILRKLDENEMNLAPINSNLDYIIPNNNNAYILDKGLFSSDAIKIDDLRFAILLTIKNTFDLLFCLFDFNKAYSGIRVRYYKLNLNSLNIHISVNIRAFVFKEYFGFLFYDSFSQYPGYMFLNYINIKSDDKIDLRTINLKLDSPTTIFKFSENLNIINNIYSDPIKIKITNFPQNIPTGILIKSLNFNSTISINDILDIEDSLIFEKINSSCTLIDEYFLEFLPVVEEIDVSQEFFKNYEESDLEEFEYFTKYPFKLIYNNSCTSEEFSFINNETEYCLISCQILELSQYDNQKVCYNNNSELQNDNNYFNKCISNYQIEYNFEKKNTSSLPKEKKTHKINYIDYPTTKNEINEQISDNITYIIDINNPENKFGNISINPNLNPYINKQNDECNIDVDSLINNYESNNTMLELKEAKKCALKYYCCSSNTNMNDLISLNSDLIYINFDECKKLLISEGVIDNNTELLVIGKQQLNISMNFDYDIYIKNGTKLEDLSLCDNTKIEISLPITDLKAYETAVTLNEQGYDIFNLSSSFYYDFCLSVYINNSDVTLGVRQNDIRPEENSICLDGCIYNGVNLDTKRINCLCDTDNFKENKTSNNEYKEIVKENFFIYILDMINYRIVICFKLIKNFDNYFHNYGFYIGFGIYFIILVLFTIYLFKGNRVIKIKYLHYEPKIDEKDLLGIKSSKNNLIDCGNLKNNSKISSSRSNILSRKSFLFNEQKSKEDNQKNDYNNNKKYSMKYFPDNNTNNKQFKIKNKDNKRSSVRQKKSIKKVNRFKIEVNKENDSKSPPSSTNKNLENSEKGMNIKEEVKKEEQKNVDYNELNYSQAIIKDERSVIQIFISYFNSKLDIIQIIFYPQEFSHVSVSLSLYLYELLLDLTFNALLFSDDVISQKYYNNGDLLLITSNILSIVSNIISSFIVCLIEYLVNFQEVLEAAKEETNDEKSFYKIFIKIFKFITLKIRIFYLVVFISGILCEYYLFIFCTIFKKIQTNLFTNYIIGSLWSLGYKVVFCILTTILRKIALIKKFKRLFLIAKFIDEKF